LRLYVPDIKGEERLSRRTIRLSGIHLCMKEHQEVGLNTAEIDAPIVGGVERSRTNTLEYAVGAKTHAEAGIAETNGSTSGVEHPLCRDFDVVVAAPPIDQQSDYPAYDEDADDDVTDQPKIIV
jgi:hypothetical protein